MQGTKFSYGTLVTRGVNSAKSMNLDSCSLDSCNLQSGSSTATVNNFYNAERINIYNSTINNSTEAGTSYSYGILDSNCIVNNSLISVGTNTNASLIASTLNNTSINVTGSPVTISHSTLINSPVFGIPSSSLNIDASQFTSNNPDTSLYPRYNGVSYLIATAQANITGATFTGISEVDALLIQGVSGDTTTTIAHNTFTGFGDAVTVNSFATQMHVDSNNFETVKKYDIINYSPKNFNAVYDYYQLAAGQTPADLIYDHNDDATYGYVFYIPYANEILPVHLVTFTGNYNNTQIVLKWQTANEVNTGSFVVQHLVNGSYEDAGSLLAKGGASNSYSFTPGSINSGANIYRLKIIDKDGTFTYSSSISVSVPSLALTFKVYPNPATQYIIISHSKAEVSSQLQLTDMSGKIIKTLVVAKDDVQNRMATNGLAKGLYQVIWRNGSVSQTSKILIQ